MVSGTGRWLARIALATPRAIVACRLAKAEREAAYRSADSGSALTRRTLEEAASRVKTGGLHRRTPL